MVDAPVIHPDDEVLGLPDVAKALGVTRATAMAWALRGRFKAREIAGRTYVRRQDLEAFKATLSAPRKRRRRDRDGRRTAFEPETRSA